MLFRFKPGVFLQHAQILLWLLKSFIRLQKQLVRQAYLAGLLLLADALGLLVLLGPLRQVGVVGQAAEQRRHLGPGVHLLLLERTQGGDNGWSGGEEREKWGGKR